MRDDLGGAPGMVLRENRRRSCFHYSLRRNTRRTVQFVFRMKCEG